MATPEELRVLEEETRRIEERAERIKQREKAAEANLANAAALTDKANQQKDLDERERALEIREQAAATAMQAAEELMNENMTRTTPTVKVNMECPLLDDCPSFEQYQKLVNMWANTTDVNKAKLGSVLAMTVPIDSTKYGPDLREDLFARQLRREVL